MGIVKLWFSKSVSIDHKESRKDVAYVGIAECWHLPPSLDESSHMWVSEERLSDVSETYASFYDPNKEPLICCQFYFLLASRHNWLSSQAVQLGSF